MPQTSNPELGFDVPIPMASPSPGVVDIMKIYQMYAQQLRTIEGYLAAGNVISTATASTNATQIQP